MSENGLIVSNPERLTPEHFVTKLKDTLRRENIPIQELSILTTLENYPIYMGLEIVKQSFERTEIPLTRLPNFWGQKQCFFDYLDSLSRRRGSIFSLKTHVDNII